MSISDMSYGADTELEESIRREDFIASECAELSTEVSFLGVLVAEEE